MKAKLLVSCPGGRYTSGEIGEVLINDSEKYQYRLLLPGTMETPFGNALRVMYFYAEEVELLNDPT